MHQVISVKVPVSGDPFRLARALSDTNLQRVFLAMGKRLRDISLSTFGAAGRNRAEPWPALSPAYMRRIRYFGLPRLILRTDLINSVGVTDSNASGCTVGSLVRYASAHQHGVPPYLPRRPWLPITGGKLTPFAEKELQTAAQNELGKIMMGV